MANAAKILLVDDDVTLHQMYAERLKAEGYKIISAFDGEESLAQVEKEMPDLVLLDIMMPKINGIDVMKKMRAEPKTANIPIILLTALIQEIGKIKDMMQSYDSYLIKSEVMPADVVQEIEKSFEKFRAAQK